MSSSVVEFQKNQNQQEGKEEEEDEDENQRQDLFHVDESTFLKAAISFKNQVVEATLMKDEPSGGGGGVRNKSIVDPTVYMGLLGTAFACLRSYEATGDEHDMLLCAEIVDKCLVVATTSIRHVTFLCGRGGVYALGAVVANYRNDLQRRQLFLALFVEMAQERALPVGPEEGGFGMSYELLYGRAGFLWAALFINKYLGVDTISKDLLEPVVQAVLAGGRTGASDNPACPLMYRWHGTRYWGAAHGLAGILNVLLHFPLSGKDEEDVKGTLRYMMRNRFRDSGNYPMIEGNPIDKLVQWSHGATSMAITLCKASQVCPDRDFRDAAIEAGEVVWKNGLVRRVGLADGVSGNAYAFLSLYRMTGEPIYLERAKAFAIFLYRNASKLVSFSQVHGSDYSYSLFHGLAGTACLLFDITSPESSRFPGFEL